MKTWWLDFSQFSSVWKLELQIYSSLINNALDDVLWNTLKTESRPVAVLPCSKRSVVRENKTALLVIRMWSSMETKTTASNGTLIGLHTEWFPVSPKVDHCCRMTPLLVHFCFHQCLRQPCPILSPPWSQSGVEHCSEVLLRAMPQNPGLRKPLHLHSYRDFPGGAGPGLRLPTLGKPCFDWTWLHSSLSGDPWLGWSHHLHLDRHPVCVPSTTFTSWSHARLVDSDHSQLAGLRPCPPAHPRTVTEEARRQP